MGIRLPWVGLNHSEAQNLNHLLKAYKDKG